MGLLFGCDSECNAEIQHTIPVPTTDTAWKLNNAFFRWSVDKVLLSFLIGQYPSVPQVSRERGGGRPFSLPQLASSPVHSVWCLGVCVCVCAHVQDKDYPCARSINHPAGSPGLMVCVLRPDGWLGLELPRDTGVYRRAPVLMGTPPYPSPRMKRPWII